MRFCVAVLLLILTACASHAPVSLDPTGQRIWMANEAVVILGTVQHASIELNKIQVCDGAAPSPPVCHPLLSDRNTGIVVDAVTDGLTTLRALPAGWKATTVAVLDRIQIRLDAAGLTKFTPYLTAGRSALALL